ncbi:polysaccharide deacetylase family protein [Salibacterium salarium]|uniref:polysaccharide deacetylase family protein n=1 Tax=Salibacterium salarium TaxID=284579 RepID=UPI001FE434ED|nr:polysaccharide deacetylase family protein [Salibacterium salarium]
MYDLKDDRWLLNLGEIQSADKKVVLTFDDGPSRILQEILDILKDKDVRAVFSGSQACYMPNVRGEG